MFSMPSEILFVWARGVLSVALLLLGPYLLWEWYEESHVWITPNATTQSVISEQEPRREFHFEPGLNDQTALLAGAAAALLVSLAGGPLLLRLLWRRGKDDPKHTRGGNSQRLRRDDGTELQVETYGDESRPLMLLTHGLGTTSTEWYYARRDLGDAFRVSVWDTLGLGESTPPKNGDFTLARLADDLLAVAEQVSAQAGGKPVLLAGHSMGGMIQLELCKRHPDQLGRLIAGIIQVDSTYTNPLLTSSHPSLYTALQKPLIEPLLHLTIWLSPLVRLFGALSYMNGSAHLSRKRSGFGGTETYGQIDFIARYAKTVSPAVNAKIALSMLRWDATHVLPNVNAPALIFVGDRDPVCTPEASGTMHGAMPKAKLKTVSPGKHYAQIEHHADFATAVKAFANQPR